MRALETSAAIAQGHSAVAFDLVRITIESGCPDRTAGRGFYTYEGPK
jgi:hypothetical protein